MVELVTGPKALELINNLHGKNIIVEAGAIGTYQVTGKQPAMIWISRSKTSDLTREQAEVMADKMLTNPHSPFHAPETFMRNTIKVYKFLGMGQVHYVFYKERLGFWISAPLEDGEKLLRYFLKGGVQDSLKMAVPHTEMISQKFRAVRIMVSQNKPGSFHNGRGEDVPIRFPGVRC